jgi:hypothetical protein
MNGLKPFNLSFCGLKPFSLENRSFHPGGMTANSRGLSRAIPPVYELQENAPWRGASKRRSHLKSSGNSIKNFHPSFAHIGSVCALFFFSAANGFAQVLLPPASQGAPGGPAFPDAKPAPSIRPIEPPVYVFPYPAWVVAVAVIILLALIGLAVWGFIRYRNNRPQPAPPTPREVALAALNALREQVTHLEPYPFSIEVSDVLRSYLSAEYNVRAREQTAPEFLAAVAGSPRISEGDRALLAAFLELSDLIKFARLNARQESSEQLLEQALRFVEKGEAPV